MAPKKTWAPADGTEHRAALLPRPVIWVGSSKDDISALPAAVKGSFGHRLRQVQEGRVPLDMRPLRQFGPGVFELREHFDKNAYRLMYVVLKKAVYVLHAFMKKSKSGIGIPRLEVELIEARLKRARRQDAEG
ncbi:MAG: type II toxin-antitoxin system RelE/ParE family toxin [Candidatus Binatus sp.]